MSAIAILLGVWVVVMPAAVLAASGLRARVRRRQALRRPSVSSVGLPDDAEARRRLRIVA